DSAGDRPRCVRSAPHHDHRVSQALRRAVAVHARRLEAPHAGRLRFSRRRLPDRAAGRRKRRALAP
ncbi:MAG: hypothetical protein AVDCRST_MAG42-1343, partial [uncultured Chthoniobacterales bacterium]